MNIQEIRTYWTNKGYTPYMYTGSQLVHPGLNTETIQFLKQCGLPSDSAPFLSFNNKNGQPLETVANEYNIDMEELNNYLKIGFNGCGDPVCIDLVKNNEIVYLNHDNDFERVYINKNIEKFVYSLMRFTDFIAITNSSNSSNFLNGYFDKNEIKKLEVDLYNIDNTCIESESMWGIELHHLKT